MTDGGTHRFVAGRVDYNGAMAKHYDAGRRLSAGSAAAWRAALAPHLEHGCGQTVLDVGAGTGRFAVLVADWFGKRVIGVEPAQGMRTMAQRHPSVAYVGGRAEAIPLLPACCDAALLSNVIHHITDRPRCARELRRVLRAGAPVLIGGAFAGRLDDISVFRYFPEAKQVAEQFPSVEEVAETFAAAGFVFGAVQRVTQQTSASLREVAARTRTRADTTLALLTDEEFARGQAALERAAEAEVEPHPVIDTLDLLVLVAA
jgi:SAM-dependent methyltransferase